MSKITNKNLYPYFLFNSKSKPKLSSLNKDLTKHSRTRSVSDLLSSQIKEKKKKKSILETLNNKPLKEQYKEIEEFWEAQIKHVNNHAINFKRVKIGDFEVTISSTCKLKNSKNHSPAIANPNKDPQLISQNKKNPNQIEEPDPIDEFTAKTRGKPISSLVKDCKEARSDAQAWFVSTMHLYIKIFFAQEIQNGDLIKDPKQKGFFKSLYSSYLDNGSNKKNKKEETEKLDLLKDECWDVTTDDVMDSFGAEIMEFGKFCLIQRKFNSTKNSSALIIIYIILKKVLNLFLD